MFNRNHRRDLHRGYSIDYVQFFFSYVVEAAIIVSGFYASYIFASRYVADDWRLWMMAIVGGLAVAATEGLRLFLAKASRTQKGFWPKFCAVVGMLLMCAVTTKSMAQVMDQVFSPRLRQVQEASDDLKRVEGDMAMLKAKKTAAEAAAKPLSESVEGLDKQISDLNSSLQAIGEAPKPVVEKQSYKAVCSSGKGKSHKTWSCNRTRDIWKTADYQGKPIIDQIADARQEREEAAVKRDAAAKVATGVDAEIAEQQNKVTAMESAKRKAVGASQIHSFTAMAFGKDPVDVTDGEIHWFLRLFVLLPALAIALSSSFGMVTSITVVKRNSVETTSSKKLPEIEIANSQTLQRWINANVAETLKQAETNNVVRAFSKGDK